MEPPRQSGPHGDHSARSWLSSSLSFDIVLRSVKPDLVSIASRRAASAETRAALMESAARVFVQRGLHGATVRQIADDAGFTNPVLYYHFGGKEELYTALIRDAFAHLKSLVQEGLADEGDTETRLRAIAAAYLRFGREDPLRLRMLYAELFQPQGADPELGFDELRDWVVAQIDAVLGAGIEHESLPIADPVLARRLFVALLGGLLVQQARDPELKVLDDDALDRTVVETFLHGVIRAGTRP